MLNKLDRIGKSHWYWLALLVLGLSLEAVALIYQYVWGYPPCILCIHVRIWVMALVLVAILGLLLRRNRALRVVAHVLLLTVAIGLLERSWMLLGIERGFIESDCAFDSSLPSWLPLDVWIPQLFQVTGSCGYTPELLFGITMAEGLIVMSAMLILATIAFLIATLFGRSFG